VKLCENSAPSVNYRFTQKTRVLSSPRQNARLPYVTQNVLLTVAAFRPWRGSQCSAAQDPAPDEAMKTHESSESVGQ